MAAPSSSPCSTLTVRGGLVALTLSGVVGLGATEAEAAPYQLDTAHSTVVFRAQQAIFGDTEGTFHRLSAELDLDRDDVSTSTVVVRIDAASVDTGNDDRDDHLKKEDFFHVDAHPEIRFESSRVEPTSEGARVHGTLYVKDTATKVVLPLRLTWSDEGGRRVVHAQGTTEVNRYDAGLDYDTPFFIPEISKMIELEVNARASRPLAVTTSTSAP